jgi:hypothetical protein
MIYLKVNNELEKCGRKRPCPNLPGVAEENHGKCKSM